MGNAPNMPPQGGHCLTALTLVGGVVISTRPTLMWNWFDFRAGRGRKNSLRFNGLRTAATHPICSLS